MRKNCKIILFSIIVLACQLNLQAQTDSSYKNILLDGKPAKLNEVTGEITLVGAKGNTASYVVKNSEGNSTESLNYHTVVTGENLMIISEQYGLSLNEIKEANNLSTTLISVGQKLRIRNFNEVDKTNSADVWVVSKGNTLYYISRKTGVSIEILKLLNGLKNSNLSIGQKLFLK